jgi:hypothetical protein
MALVDGLFYVTPTRLRSWFEVFARVFAKGEVGYEIHLGLVLVGGSDIKLEKLHEVNIGDKFQIHIEHPQGGPLRNLEGTEFYFKLLSSHILTYPNSEQGKVEKVHAMFCPADRVRDDEIGYRNGPTQEIKVGDVIPFTIQRISSKDRCAQITIIPRWHSIHRRENEC